MLRILGLSKPISKCKVVELVVAGPIGRWFKKRNWAAVTIPLPFFVFILYWASDRKDTPNPYTRVHEFIHVFQSEQKFFYLLRYFRESWKNGYENNKYERDAYLQTRSCMDRRALPDWAKPFTK